MATRWETTFFDTLAQTGSVTKAAARAHKDRDTAYYHKRVNPDFAERWERALEQYGDVLEAEMFRRAHEGTLKPVFYKGEQCGEIGRAHV